MQSFSGHGSAMAQAYNHLIMPLANSRDKRTQVIWGLKTSSTDSDASLKACGSLKPLWTWKRSTCWRNSASVLRSLLHDRQVAFAG